jgi:drug/metabolite transporter (DMT)-like permease
MYNLFLYLITVLIWGLTWVAIKFQLGVVAPEVSITYRFILASAILFIFSLSRRLPLKFAWRSHLFFALQGFFLFSLNYILVYNAEIYLSSGLVAIIFSTIVLFNVLFGALFLGNPIRFQVVLGAVIGLIGLTLVFGLELLSFDLADQVMLGIVLSILAVISASLGNIVSAHNQRNELPVVQTNAFGMAYGALFMLLLALVRGAAFNFDPSPSYLMGLLYLSIFGSVIAFGCYLTLLGRIGPDRAAYVSVLFPIIALIVSTMYEGLSWNLSQFMGAGLVLLGNVMVLSKKEYRGLAEKSRPPQ